MQIEFNFVDLLKIRRLSTQIFDVVKGHLFYKRPVLDEAIICYTKTSLFVYLKVLLCLQVALFSSMRLPISFSSPLLDAFVYVVLFFKEEEEVSITRAEVQCD